MVRNAGLASKHDEVAKLATAGNAYLRDNYAVTAGPRVVPNLHQIINLGALADDGVAQRSTIDRRAGADLHLVLDDDATELGNLEVSGRARRKPEAGLAESAHPGRTVTPSPR